MKEYEISEQLFLDVWESYGCPDEVSDLQTIYNILNELILKSRHWIVLDHYSHINFDEIIKVEYDKEKSIFKLYWLDNNRYRIKNLKHELEEFEAMVWSMSGYCTYEYIALDIKKIKFVKHNTHIYVLLQANVTTEKELRAKVIGNNEVIEIDNCTDELYARYIFWEGDKDDLIKVECIANNLPYYVCLIQPKEGIQDTFVSKRILLSYTLREINERLEKVGKALEVEIVDTDELFSKGNTIRNIMEFALKHYCVVMGVKLDIEKKYGHIDLGELKRKIKVDTDIDIPQNLINRANELSHDSGKKYDVRNLRIFYREVVDLITKLQQEIFNMEQKN